MSQPWLRHYAPDTASSYPYPRIPLYRLLQDSAARFPARNALIYCDGENCQELGTLTYQALDEESDHLAAALVDLGINQGDRVAYFLQNSPHLVVGFYGILKAGMVVVPCNPMYQAQELAHQLKDSGAKAILCDPELYAVVNEVAGQTELEHIIVAGDAPPAGAHSLQALIDSQTGSSAVRSHPSIQPEADTALLCYTGGTTGVPKGAMLTHYNLVANVLQFKNWFQYRDGEEIFLSVLPLFHIGGIAGAMSVPLACGGTMVLFRRFNARGALQAIEQYRASRFLGVPTMYVGVLNLPEASSFDLSSLRASRTSAAPLPKAVKEAFDDLVGHEVLIEGYGLTDSL